MKTFLKCMYEAAGRNNKLANYMNTYNTSIHNIEPLLNEAAEIYAKQSNSHKPVVGGPVSDVRSEGEQLGNEGSATVAEARDFRHCYIRTKIGCHCTDECGYDAVMRGISDEGQP